MARKALSTVGEIVKKNNELIRTKVDIANVDGARILANMVACVHESDTAFKDSYRVEVKEVLSDLGGGSYTRIKAVCRELAKATAETEKPNPKGSHPIFRAITFFSYIEYAEGIIEAKFNPEIAPFLMELRRCFTEYHLEEYLMLPSIYSQRIFEILKSWSGLPEVEISLTDLHRMLNTPPSFRNNFKNFRIFALEKAHADIHEHTSLKFEWEPLKAGRSVEKIRFSFSGCRKAIAEKEKEKLKEEKARRIETNRFLRAIECAKNKQGDCWIQDNQPVVCKICKKFNCCGDFKKL